MIVLIAAAIALIGNPRDPPGEPRFFGASPEGPRGKMDTLVKKGM
jgi:hypothetical protein